MADCVNQLRQLPGINKGFTDLHPRNSLCHPETDSRRQLGELSELEVAPFHTLHPNIKVIAKDKHFEDSIYFQQCDVLSYAFTAASAPLVASQSCSCRERRTLKYRKKRMVEPAAFFFVHQPPLRPESIMIRIPDLRIMMHGKRVGTDDALSSTSVYETTKLSATHASNKVVTTDRCTTLWNNPWIHESDWRMKPHGLLDHCLQISQ